MKSAVAPLSTMAACLNSLPPPRRLTFTRKCDEDELHSCIVPIVHEEIESYEEEGIKENGLEDTLGAAEAGALLKNPVARWGAGG